MSSLIQKAAVLAALIAAAACVAEPSEVVDSEVDIPDTIAQPSGNLDEIGADADRLARPGRDQQVHGCEADCDGEWGAHGRSAYEWCLCRSDDAFASCYSADDCTGFCLFDGLEHSAGDDGAAVPFGHCSEFELEFGCFRYLPAGVEGPVELPFEPPSMCVD